MKNNIFKKFAETNLFNIKFATEKENLEEL